MKHMYLPLLLLCCCTASIVAQPVSYPMKFRFRDSGGQLCDTAMPRVLYDFWGKSPHYPAYVKWKNQPFAIRKTESGRLSLFADSASSFSSGQQVGVAYVRRSSSGRFDLDFVQTDFAAFVNDSSTPNLVPELAGRKLVFKANGPISPDTKLTVSYQAISALFPDDQSIRNTLRH